MTALALLGAGIAIVLASARGFDDRAPRDDSRAFDALLFLLCLVGIVAARSKRSDDSEEC